MKKYLVQFILGIGLPVLFSHSVSADWVNTKGPWGNGQIRALTVSGNTIIAGTDSGIFLSANYGLSWVNSRPKIYADAFAVSGNNIFAGTRGGVFLSTNNGTSWVAVNSGLTNDIVTALAASGNNIYAGTDSGVFHSTNNGTNWIEVNNGLPPDSLPDNGYVTSFAVSGSTILAGYGPSAYGSNGYGIFRSTDNGTTWTAVNNGLTNTAVLSLAVAGNNIFAGTYTNEGYGVTGGSVFLSTNNGISWTAVGSGLPTINIVMGFTALPKSLTVWSLAASGNNIFAGTDGGHVFLSANNGTSWTAVDSGLPTTFLLYDLPMVDYEPLASLAVSGSYIFAGSYSGLWRRPLSEMIGATDIKQQQGLLKQENICVHGPNRINHAVTIEFSLPHPDQVTAKIFNLSGHEIASLVDKQFGSGLHVLTWDTRDKASGCYAVRMRVGSNTYVKSIPLFR